MHSIQTRYGEESLMTKPPIGPASPPPEKKVFKITIVFDGENLGVDHPADPILCLGMMRLAEAELIAKLSGHQKENKGGGIIIPNMSLKGIKVN